MEGLVGVGGNIWTKDFDSDTRDSPTSSDWTSRREIQSNLLTQGKLMTSFNWTRIWQLIVMRSKKCWHGTSYQETIIMGTLQGIVVEHMTFLLIGNVIHHWSTRLAASLPSTSSSISTHEMYAHLHAQTVRSHAKNELLLAPWFQVLNKNE